MDFESPQVETKPASTLPAEIEAALERAARELTRLIDVSAEELEATDVPDLARDVYALSYRHLKAFFSRIPLSFREHETQAKLALGFVASAERTRLQVLQLGRNRGDASIEAQLKALREETMRIAEYKAKVLHERATEARETSNAQRSG